MKDVGKLMQLKSLSITRCPITDAGLKELAPLKKLQYLDLGETRITGSGFQLLARFPISWNWTSTTRT